MKLFWFCWFFGSEICWIYLVHTFVVKFVFFFYYFQATAQELVGLVALDAVVYAMRISSRIMEHTGSIHVDVRACSWHVHYISIGIWQRSSTNQIRLINWWLRLQHIQIINLWLIILTSHIPIDRGISTWFIHQNRLICSNSSIYLRIVFGHIINWIF